MQTSSSSPVSLSLSSPRIKRPRRSSPRVVLLLDLDCFYSQCECIRLGWDAAVTPLALLQWNSVLAVTYPARRQFNIQRGDSWKDVQTKSKGACHAVHVALLLSTNNNATQQSTTSKSEQQQQQQQQQRPPIVSSLQEEYNDIYKASPEEQELRRRNELGVRRHSTAGKACIERYRTASAVILETVQAWIAAHDSSSSSSSTMILERASIDEFFLDVTAAVASSSFMESDNKDTADSVETTRQVTVRVGETQNDGNNDDKDDVYYWRGAAIARQIRDYIRQELGFTLSAGIAGNKTLAKLSASYGKPNGQAITLPRHVSYLLQQTPIHKCRNLGGKLGRAVAALLPVNVEPTVGNIAQYLSLPELQEGLRASKFTGDSVATFVHHLAHGRDDEAVTGAESLAAGTANGLTKSITAFKSFPMGRTVGLTLTEAADWIRLLAQEIVGRLERDRIRYHRYPRSCSIQYALPGWRSQQSRSVRIPFPTQGLSAVDKVTELCAKVPVAVAQKEGKTQRFGRIGLCATDFVVREAGQRGMNVFFQSSSSAQQPSATKELAANMAVSQSTQPASPSVPDKSLDGTRDEKTADSNATSEKVSSEDADFALARKLQASYDRENQAWQQLDQRSRKRKQQQQTLSTKKISSFFRKR